MPIRQPSRGYLANILAWKAVLPFFPSSPAGCRDVVSYPAVAHRFAFNHSESLTEIT